MKKYSLVLLAFLLSASFNFLTAKLDPIKWGFYSKQINDTTYELSFEATLKKNWHIYSQYLENDNGPVPTTINIKELKGIKAIGKTEELGELQNEFDPNFDMQLKYFSNKVVFSQIVSYNLSDLPEKLVKAELEYMICDPTKCLPPNFIEISFNLSSGKGHDALEDAKTSNIDINSVIPLIENLDIDNPKNNCEINGQAGGAISGESNWMIFIFGLIGGFLALLTPCVFPMIPLTVSFFTKDSKGKKGIMNAFLYGFFIFLIYTALSIPFHFNTNPAVLNEIATSVWLNVSFFTVFLVFAISFFGYFEITMPSSIANKTENASSSGGILGIFFMALTLALVSFSCTGPILGTVLGNALKDGPWPISSAMMGFGVALGLPFALFALFPGILQKLPKSGGWLNSVKVVLGFIELALALKFLSNADLVEQWGLIKRETFFLVWLIICIALILYLVGLIKFPHDSPIKKFTKFRTVFTVIVIAFTVYIAPGVMKSPPWNHNLLSGFPPPMFYSWYDSDTFHAEYNDFNAAFEKAKEENKPLLIDFTGWACVNCRKMEESVWTVKEVKEKLEKDFILVSLYVDDKTALPEEQQGVFTFGSGENEQKKLIKSIGNKWATFQNHVFRNQSQPFYAIVSPEGELLTTPVGYTPKVKDYLDFLNCGLK